MFIIARIANKSHRAAYEKFAGGSTKDISNELPFKTPEGWAWARLGSFSFITKLAGFEYSNVIANSLTDHGIPIFKGKNIQGHSIIETFEDYIPDEISLALPRSRIAQKCLLLPYVGTIGNVAVFDGSYVGHLGSNVAKIEFQDKCGISEEYVSYIVRSPIGYKLLTHKKKATAQESLSMEALREVCIPLPPREIELPETVHRLREAGGCSPPKAFSPRERRTER